MRLFLIICFCLVTVSFRFMMFRAVGVRKVVRNVKPYPLNVPKCPTIKKKSLLFCSDVNIECKLEKSIIEELLRLKVPEFATILLCVSGGADSIALLHLMNAIKQERMPLLDLKVVNFNHKQRFEADEEAQFVSRIAESYGNDIMIKDFPLHFANKSFAQELGRKWRRDECQAILATLTNQTGSKYIATAHHMDDQIETLMMKLIRGVHITNLSMMKPLTGPFLKPMLTLHKSDILQYLTEHNFEWREDSSNQERNYTRNKVRLDLIPIMNELAGGQDVLQRRLSALSKQSKQISLLLEQQVIEVAKSLRTFYFDNYHILSFEHLHRGAQYINPADIPAVVLQQILRSWLMMTIGLQINDYSMLSGIAALFQADLKSRKSIAITISKKWDVVRIAKELRLVPRSRGAPTTSNLKISKLSHKGIDILIEHSSFVLVGIQQKANSSIDLPKFSVLGEGGDAERSNEDNNKKEIISNTDATIQQQPYSAKFDICIPLAVPNRILNLVVRLLQPDDKSLLIAERRVSKLISEKSFCDSNERDRVFIVMHHEQNGAEECLAVFTENSYFPTEAMLSAESRDILSLQLDIASRDQS